MKLNVQLSIARCSDGTIRLTIDDVLSRVKFAELTVGLAEFAAALTGLSGQPAVADVSGLQHVGKQHVREDRTIECPLQTYNRDELKQWLIQNAQEDGWLLDTYLGSQSSIQYNGDKTILRYSVHKYVDVAP